MSPSFALVGSLLLGLVVAQTPGTAPEVHPKLTTWKCTNGKKGCVEQKTAVVLDSATHWIHQKNNTSVGCSVADKAACPDEASCAKNCVIDGISTYADYGVTTQGGNLKMTMYGKNGVASPRIYLLAEGEQKYEMMKLVNKEFTFDIDASKLPCGMNSALYLSEMKENGGKDKYNAGGAAYGTGYCDAQCFVTPWVEGKVRRLEYPSCRM
jgi:cellulase